MTRRNVRERVDRLESEGDPKRYPNVGLTTIFRAFDDDVSAVWVSREEQILDIDDQRYSVPNQFFAMFDAKAAFDE